MSSLLRQKVRDGKAIPPTRKGFTRQGWEDAWNEIAQEDPDSESLYLAGCVVFDLLEAIRSRLQLLMNQAPCIRNEELIIAYTALANRDRFILSKQLLAPRRGQPDVLSETYPGNFGINQLTFQEIADGAVDGLHLAIYECLQRSKGGCDEISSADPMPAVDFVSNESILSQLYSATVAYWNVLIWTDSEFVVADSENLEYLIRQQPTLFERSVAYSHIRRQRLAAQRVGHLTSEQSNHLGENEAYIVPSKNGKRKTLRSRPVNSSNPAIVNASAAWKLQESSLIEQFPDDFLNNRQEPGFSILEALNVYRCLALLALQLNDSYPENDGFNNLTKLSQYCPIFQVCEIRRSISLATGLQYSRVEGILSFLEFRVEQKDDLWCRPLIKVRGMQYALLTAALVTPVLTRLVEHWLVALQVDLQQKGFTYESTVLASVNNALRSNTMISDFSEAESKRIKVKDDEEEIDLIARVGNLILVGEIKSIVTTDSPISQFRAMGVLKKASLQASRKANFVKSNIENIFGALGWKFNKGNNYTVSKFIINSNRMFVGSIVENVPVVDELIVSHYLASGSIPNLSTFDDKSGNFIHLAWFQLR